MFSLNDKQKQNIWDQVNKQGQNLKNINFYKVIGTRRDGLTGQETVCVEIGYWITYIGCIQKYSKETIYISKLELNGQKT